MENNAGVKLYVGNLSYKLNPEDLRAEFQQAGEVTDVFLPTDKMTGRKRGFGFVTMADQAGADKAISMFHEKDIDGRKITVNVARPKEEGAPRGGMGGGRSEGGYSRW